MNIKQVANLKKIMRQFDADYRLSEQVLSRHDELDNAIPLRKVLPLFAALESLGIRHEVIEAAMDDMEFQETAAAMIRELTGIVARYDVADQIDSARHAA
ncbi:MULTISPECIES: hypothetical protein [unclassified Cedecea]|uniref:hypothetical protein n=1 Tax=unclassified Cedecea TaxID=2649846 RepID=UPI0030175C39